MVTVPMSAKRSPASLERMTRISRVSGADRIGVTGVASGREFVVVALDFRSDTT
jgi:hypothetical protein